MIVLQTVWGWPSALYLFLGGLSGGTCLASMALLFYGYKRYRRVIAVSQWIAFILLVAGLLVLLLELSNPARALLMWKSFSNDASWMARGAWMLLGAVLLFGFMAVFLSDALSSVAKKAWDALPFRKKRIRRVLAIICGGFALGVIAYTGFLLQSAVGIPFWQSPLLPTLFILSALSGGVNVIALVSLFIHGRKVSYRERRFLSMGVIALLVAEGIVLTFFIGDALAGDSRSAVESAARIMSAESLLHGTYAVLFWGLFVGCGLVIPFLTSLGSLLVKKKDGHIFLLLSAFCSLIGECAFRMAIVYAGAHADYVAQAIVGLLA